MAHRGLKNNEIELLSKVFLLTLPYDEIAITDKLGLGDAPYTMPNLIGSYKYHINVGDYYNKDMSASTGGQRLLIHEATHVWQGEHRWWEWSYVFESGLCQAISAITSGSRNGAYDYTAGKDWTDYNAEQQAAIVEDWYINGMSTSSSLWQYIRDSIRKPGFSDRKAYFFQNTQYIRWSLGSGKDSGYPKSIENKWSSFVCKVNAAFNRLTGTTEKFYFFKGDEYIRWTYGKGMDNGYPKKIADEWDADFMGDGIDACINYDNEKIYFFKGNQYLRWTLGTGKKDDGYPKLISENWPSFMHDGIDTAFNGGNGKAYFFKGDEYIRITIGEGIDDGYPKKIDEEWEDEFMKAGFNVALMKRG